MRDEDDGKSLTAKAGDDAIQPLALRLPERRRGLIHDQDAVFRLECPHNLKQLLAGDGQRSRARIGIQRDAETIGQFAETLDRGATVEKRPPGLLPAQEDVSHGSQFGQDRPLLIYDPDAGLSAAREHRAFSSGSPNSSIKPLSAA